MKRVYVSDVHMGAGQGKPGPTDYDWLSKSGADSFAKFLKHMNQDPEVEEVILLGDIMDNWVCPIDVTPPTFDEIISAPKNAQIKVHLEALAANPKKKVVYLPGNHDMGITEGVLAAHFPDIVFGGSAADKSRYRTSRLLAEHGSAYALFNAPDPLNSPGNRLPLGYYISRVAATKKARTGGGKRHFYSYIDDMLEILGPERLAASVFEAVVEEADLRGDDSIQMPPIGGKPVSVLISDVKEKYAALYDQWKEQRGKGMAFKAVMAEIGYLGDLADHLSKSGDTNIVIFGHSHDSELDKDSWFVKDRIYANCGTWCGDKCTYVESEKNEAARAYTIRLMQWNSATKAPSVVGEKTIDL